MFNTQQFKEIRSKETLSTSDEKALVLLQKFAYESYLVFKRENQNLKNNGNESLKNISISDYLTFSLSLYNKIYLSKDTANQLIFEDKNFYESAQMYVCGKAQNFSEANTQETENKDRYEDLVKATIIKTALTIPIKNQLQEIKEKSKHVSNENYLEFSRKINELRDIYSLASKLAENRLCEMHKANYKLFDEREKPRYSEIDLDVAEYQMYCIDQKLAKIIKMQNKIENKRVRKVRNIHVAEVLENVDFFKEEHESNKTNQENQEKE